MHSLDVTDSSHNCSLPSSTTLSFQILEQPQCIYQISLMMSALSVSITLSSLLVSGRNRFEANARLTADEERILTNFITLKDLTTRTVGSLLPLYSCLITSLSLLSSSYVIYFLAPLQKANFTYPSPLRLILFELNYFSFRLNLLSAQYRISAESR